MASEPSEILGLDQVLLAVRDCDVAAEALALVLGRPASWRGSREGGELESAGFDLPNCCIHVVAPAKPGPSSRAIEVQLERKGEGMFGLAFRCADLDAALASAREGGVAAARAAESIAPAEAGGSWRAAALAPQSSFGIPIWLLERVDREVSGSPPRGGEGAVEALDHVVQLSTALDEMAAFYGDTLGLRLALDREFPKRGVRLLFFRTGGTTVEIGGPLEVPPDAGRGARFGGLAWRVSNVVAAHERLLAEGLPVSEARKGHKAGTRVFTVKGGTLGVPTLVIGPDPEAS